MNTQKVSFSSDGLKLFGNIVSPDSPEKHPGVLFLHGGGKAIKERYLDWQDIFSAAGIVSFCFDFRGAGESGGKFEDGGLNNRLTDATNALNFFADSKQVDKTRLVLAGNSMGAHVAIRLLERRKDVKAILLTCAAAYSQKAEKMPLNDEFSQVIRQENSWVDSPVFTILENFPGKIMVSYGQFDEVIPQGVKDKFGEICQKRNGQVLILKGGTHKLLQPQNESEEQARQQLFIQTRDFILANV